MPTEDDGPFKLRRLRLRVRINETDMAARAELAREEDRTREVSKQRREQLRNVRRLVGDCLQAIDEYVSLAFEDIREEAPGEYSVRGRAYTGKLFPQWTDFEVMVNMQTGEVRLKS